MTEAATTDALRTAAENAADVLDEARTYTSSESWSPSMTEECDRAIRLLRDALAAPAGEPAAKPRELDKHGHVRPRHDGVKARCGGPAICKHCQGEQLLIAGAAPTPAPAPAVPAPSYSLDIQWPPMPTPVEHITDSDGRSVPVFRRFQMRDYALTVLAAATPQEAPAPRALTGSGRRREAVGAARRRPGKARG